MPRSQKRTDKQIQEDKTTRIMRTIALRCAYYRANPQRFAEEFLGLKLKLFQKIVLWAMMTYDAFYFVACRGIGKTFLVALFAVCRAILYPGSKIIACSYTFKQGKEIILKITDDFMLKSPLLRNEISKTMVGQNDCAIYFKNGSFIRVVVAGESARGSRSNVLIIDESRMVPQKIVDTVLRPMNAAPRQPGYLRKPQYAHLKEMNKEMYLSSAYFAASEMYEKVKAYTANMLNDQLKYFVCIFPYMLSIMEGLLMRQAIENEMSEATFSDISFSMERLSFFYGSSLNSIFDFKVLNSRRVLNEALYDLQYYKNNNVKIPEKVKNEYRVLSVDVALLASKKHDNDASALLIHSAIPTPSHNYMDNIVGIDTKEGLTTEELGLHIMRVFYQFDCDYLALDANGVGQGVLDYIMGGDRFDSKYGVTYGCMDVINAPDLASRCKVRGARKCVYAIKANGKLNNDMLLALRAGFQNGYINLLRSDMNLDEYFSKMRGYSKLSDEDKTLLQLPYLQTSFLINELINLSHDTSNGLIRVKERSGMRKDRFSSLEYGYYVIQELSKKLKPKTTVQSYVNSFTVRPPRKVGRF